MEEEQRYFNVLIEMELYEKYKILKDVTEHSKLESMKLDLVKNFINEYKGQGYDEWNNEEYVMKYLKKIIDKEIER